MSSNFTIPTETVELPSKGLLYPADSPLAEGKIEMKYMTAKEEDILTNQNYIQKGIVVDKLLESLIVSKVNFNDILIGDKDALLIASRILGYGKDYEFNYAGEKINVDLTKLTNKELDEKLVKDRKNEFTYKLPNTDNTITFKLMTQQDEKNIQRELEGLKKVSPSNSAELSTRMKYMIISINENNERPVVREFVDKAFLAKDARAFREYYASIVPGINTTISHEFEDGVEEDLDIPINANFLWPDFGV
jgi:hypothetical protein|tara:strand:- start:53 stop:799 length:747 start_codon:yes stop_codon:yes gene_type:complete